jgi:hypothetical protein
MKVLITTALLFLLVGLAQAGPKIVVVTAEKPQAHIFVKTSHLGEGFYSFSVRTQVKQPANLRAHLILQNDKGNLLSTPMLRTHMEDGTMRVYAAVHADLLIWARIDLRYNMVLYQLQLESFKNAFEKK